MREPRCKRASRFTLHVSRFTTSAATLTNCLRTASSARPFSADVPFVGRNLNSCPTSTSSSHDYKSFKEIRRGKRGWPDGWAFARSGNLPQRRKSRADGVGKQVWSLAGTICQAGTAPAPGRKNGGGRPIGGGHRARF